LLPFDDPDAGGPLDRMTTSFAAEIVGRDKPAPLMHLVDFDHREHFAGPRTPASCRSLDQIDARVGELVAAYRRAALLDQTAFFIVSDHESLPAHTQINLTALIADAGIETRLGGGSAALYGTDERLERVRARVAPTYHDRFRWLGRADARAFGGFPDAGVVLGAKSG
jgi:predicted AlkP superfamily pyrophosphatase or phosphodiesterase